MIPEIKASSLDERDLRVLKQRLDYGEVVDLERYKSLVPEFEIFLQKCVPIGSKTGYISAGSFSGLKSCFNGFIIYLLLTDRIYGLGKDHAYWLEKKPWRIEFIDLKEKSLGNKALLYKIDEEIQKTFPTLIRYENDSDSNDKTKETVWQIKRACYDRIESKLTDNKEPYSTLALFNPPESKDLDHLVRKKAIHSWTKNSKHKVFIKLLKTDSGLGIPVTEWRDLRIIKEEEIPSSLRIHYYEFWKKHGNNASALKNQK